MEKFTKFVEEKLTPIAQFLGSERHFSALQKGFMALLPVIFVGAVFMIIANPPVNADLVVRGGLWSIFKPWFDFASKNKMTILVPFNMSMNMLGMISSFSIAYYLADSYKMSGLRAGITSLVVFLTIAAPAAYTPLADGTWPLLMPTTYLGSQGMFTAILVSMLCVEIIRFCESKSITIKMPEGVPSTLQQTFSSIIPMVVCVASFFLINLLIQSSGIASSLPALIEFILAKPVSAIDSIPGSLLLCVFILLLWCFGIHGTMVFMAITTPLTVAAFAENAALAAEGLKPVFHPIFMTNAITFLGGTGCTFALCVLSSFLAKSEQLKAFGKVSIVPSFFRISEPAIFGAPIVFNPVLAIPFILGSLVVAIGYWLCCSVGLCTAPYLMVSGTFPIFLNIFIFTLDIRTCLYELVMIPVTMLIWYPFFKAYDDQLLKEESGNE